MALLFTMELIITKRDGTKHTVLYDECDHDAVKQYTWCVTGGGVVSSHKRKNREGVILYRLILGITDKGIHVDHINHNRLDNCRKNLRLCTLAENNRNKRPQKGRRFKGVSVYMIKRGGMQWGPYIKALIRAEGKTIRLGHFPTEEDAARAYDEAAKKYHKKFAYLNFPNE